MSATRYTVRTNGVDSFTYARKERAIKEAEAFVAAAVGNNRAALIQVVTSGGKVVFDQQVEALEIADQAEVEAVLAAEDRKDALTAVAAVLGAMAAKAAARAEAAPQGPSRPTPRKTLRAPIGESVVTGWELLYDKPKQRAQVGRNAAGKYALICTDHQHAHELTRLTQERGLRQGKRSVWCTSCAD